MFKIIRKKNDSAKSDSASRAPEFLIVGLGNPGKKYEFTRHNTGFLTLDVLSMKLDFKIDRLKFKALTGEAMLSGKRCMVMKPQTFMNNSGESVRDAASFYKIPPENIIVIYDDVSLPVGKLRIRRKGSDGGHNGIKSIIYHLGSDMFPRVKIGVGEKPHPDADLASWVLSGFSKQELVDLRSASDKACEALELIVENNTDKAMNLYNS